MLAAPAGYFKYQSLRWQYAPQHFKDRLARTLSAAEIHLSISSRSVELSRSHWRHGLTLFATSRRRPRPGGQMVVVRKSTSSQRRSTSSDATRTIVASRWPHRLPLVASTSRSTSASVRYSRVRRSPLGRLLGITVRKTGDQPQARFRDMFGHPCLDNCSYNAPYPHSWSRPENIPTDGGSIPAVVAIGPPLTSVVSQFEFLMRREMELG
jgi:hypothetical protein